MTINTGNSLWMTVGVVMLFFIVINWLVDLWRK